MLGDTKFSLDTQGVRMETDLEKYLQILNSERCLKKPKEAVIIIDKICECFKVEQSQFTIGLLIGLVLDESISIFNFIWKISSDASSVSSATAAFKFLDYLVSDFPKCSAPYFSVLYEKCIYLLDTKLAKVRELSLKLIYNLLTADSKSVLDLSKLTKSLEKHLRDDNKIPGTVLEEIYIVLGFLFEKYPESVGNEANWFFNKMCETLRHEVQVTRNPLLSKIKGAFEGINGYLVNYVVSDNECLKKIYEYMKSSSKCHQDKKHVSRAALKIFQNHWTHFSSYIYQDRDFWKVSLLEWVKQSGEDHQLIISAFNSFYSIIALFLKQDFNAAVLSCYLKEFKEILDSTDTNSFEKRSALMGIKLFVLTNCVEGDDSTRTYELVMNFIRKQESYENFTYMPLCIECVSAFVLRITTDSNFYMEQLSCLHRLSVKVINQYPKMESDFQPQALTALEKSFYMLELCNLQIMEDHIVKILYQGLISSCSWMTQMDFELLKESGEKEVDSTCYKSYLGLWKYLLNLANTPQLPVGGSFNLKKGVAMKVFDAFIESFLRIVSKLNFNVGASPNSETDIEVEKPGDLNIFINCVDLYQDLIPLTDHFKLMKWLNTIFQTFISLSYKNPLVSGFYKLVATTLKVADRVQYFEDCSEENKKFKCFEYVRKFLEDILVKVDLYKGDLQVACFKTLLAAPVPLIESFVEKTIPALEVIIQVGRGHFPLLKDLVEALEHWDFHLPSSTMNGIIQKILPHFDIFFQSPYFYGNNLVDSSIEGKKLKKKLVFNDSELLTLQKRFLIFLGHIDVSKALNLIELPDKLEEERLISDKPLKYQLPFSNGSTEINLDEVLLRTIDLAVCCSDRRTRITACEFLNSAVMILLRDINQLSGGHTWLFRKIIKTCLILGCDSDSIVCQIFEPLMYQITHYFSGKKALHFSETKDLIDILMDFVTRPYDPAARDFSALLLCEFTVWSIKQLTPEELKVTPESIVRILNRIYSLALHPSYNKRVGAAVVFNKIYPILREEDFILEAYWFQLFYYFMESLRMCDGPEDVTEIVAAVKHVKRPFFERHEEFNKVSPHRLVPAEFEGGLLCHLVKWTMKRCCDVKPPTRKTAMVLVEDLAPLVSDCDSLTAFIKMHFPNHLHYPKEKSFDKIKFTDEEVVDWLRYYCSMFEYYNWLLNQGALSFESTFKSRFKAITKNYIAGILCDRTMTAEQLKQESVILYLNLVITLHSHFPEDIWNFLKICVFKPSSLGFDLNHLSTSEQLSSILTKLFRFLTEKHLKLNWDQFFENLETFFIVPVFSDITKNRQVSLNNLEFLFALRIIERSGIWNTFMKRMLYVLSGEVITRGIFECLFFSDGKNTHAVSVEPSCKLYLEELLKLGLEIGSNFDCVLTCIKNVEEVQEEETGKTLKKGEYFELLFKKVIFRYLESKYDVLIERVIKKENVFGVKLLVRILENMEPGDPARELPKKIFSQWEDLEKLKLKNVSPKQWKQMLLHLAVCGAKVVGTPGFLKLSPIAEEIFTSLETEKLKEMNAGEIEGIFGLFPFLSDLCEGTNENDRLSSSLAKFEIDEGSLNRGKATVAINGLLKGLKSTGSLVLLRFFINKVGLLENVVTQQDVEWALSVFGGQNISLVHSVAALNLVYCACFEDDKMSSFVLQIFSLFLEPLLRILPVAAIQQGVSDNLNKLCDLITTLWSNNPKMLKTVGIDLRRKICACKILQAFVTKLTKEELEGLSEEKKNLIDNIPTRCFPLVKASPPGKALKERHRIFMCEVFNMICSIICSRCTNPKFYKLFIFDERGSFLFGAVDNNVQYNLGMDFDEIPKRKKQLTLLRKTVTKERQRFLGETLKSVKYIQTNTLFTSSLREDVTQFDLTNSPIRPLNSIVGYNPEESTKHVEIELEMDSLNSHECMTTLIGVISKMAKENIEGENAGELPSWLQFFISILNSSKFSKNLKLFILKAMYNVEMYVRPFCQKVFPVVLESVLSLFANSPINYFLIDIIEMMVGWRESPEEASQSRLSQLVNFVVEKCDALRKDIVKSNLEIVKMMIEVWKDRLCVLDLSSAAFRRLCDSVSGELETNTDSVFYLNVQVSGILLSNGIPPWLGGCEREFFDLLFKNFREDNKKKEVYAEICGIALKYLKKTNFSDLGNFENMVRQKISSRHGCWVILLYSVHKHYPTICDTFVIQIFYSAWDSTDSLTVNKLEMLLSYVSRTDAPEDDFFKHHIHVFLIDMLNSSVVEVQELSLQIAEKLLDKLNEEKSQLLLKEVLKLQKSVHSGVRKWVYEIAIKMYKKNQESGLQKQCKVVLLKGLSDGVKSMEETCLGFWRGLLQFSSPYLVLLDIFQEMYTPETEDIFLSISAKILMGCAAGENQYEKSISPHPIMHRCTFKKRSLILGLRSSFFLSSTSGNTWANQSLELTATLRSQTHSFLRPTLSSLKFQPTVQENGEEVTSTTNTVSPAEEDQVLKNPFKVRFYKSATKTNFYFLKRQKQRKKKESEEMEELMRKKETEVHILGEYSSGDYPDIQISNSQVLKPLEALARADHQIARQFLVEFYSGLMNTVIDEEKATLLSATNKCFKNILKSSTSFDPGVFGFVLHVLQDHCQHLNVDCELISNAAVSSNWLSLGALIIEKYIAQQEDFIECSAKRRKGSQQPEEKMWMELAKLYRSLEEFDVLSGIFLDKVKVTGDARAALHSEALLDWPTASKCYESLLQTDDPSLRSDFFTESYFSCLAKLSDWSLLNKCIRTTVEEKLDELWKNYNLLSWFLKSEMMISLNSDQREFLTILEEFSRCRSQINVLNTNFGEEMTVFDMLSNKLQRANYRIDRLCLDFLAGWSHLNRWSHKLRGAKLTNLQTLSELSFAVRTLAESSKSQLEEDIKIGTMRWERNFPSVRDDLTVWDVKLGYRRELVKRLKDFDLGRSAVESNLALTKAALGQNNLSLAKECLSRVKGMLPEGNADLRTEYDYCFNLGKMVVAKSKMTDQELGLGMYLEVWKGISKQLSSAMESDSKVSQTRLYRCNFTLGQLVGEILPSLTTQSISPATIKCIARVLNSGGGNLESTKEALKAKGLEYFEAARDALKEDSSPEKSKIYLVMAKYILKFSSKDSFVEFEKFCRYLLKAMSLGSVEARELFGCALSMSYLIDGNCSLEELISESESVPSWMFLTWINQLLASLNSELFPFLRSIILRIAQDYPNSIRYAFKLNKECAVQPSGFQFSGVQGWNSKTKSFFVRLNSLYQNDSLFDNFLTSMNYLAPPDLILRHHLENVLQYLNRDDTSWIRMKSALTNLHQLMFSPDFEKFRGPVFKFWEKFKKPLEEIMTTRGNEVLKKKVKDILASLEAAKLPSRRSLRDLESYSPWLHNFHSLKMDTRLELPGQYDGTREPIEKNLVMISSFRTEVVVFNSKCRPMRISILGNDAKEHKFLIKFGEDLRQDQRIQQVFQHFNYRLKESKQTRGFYLETYKVIPLTVSLGMIEWIENNVSLYEMIENSLGKDADLIAKAQAEHLEFLSKDTKAVTPAAAHLVAYEKVSRGVAIANFNTRVQGFPRDLLKKAFLSLSTSPEHFMHLRGNFATSHAVMCVTHWLVGIGDRHLQNILVSTKTGRVLGIDFGYAFGFATEFLVPPELVPFRLTPQILGLLSPLNESGWIKQSMIHTLRLFRKEHFGFLSILEVFVQEPVMDWSKQAKKNERCKNEDSDSWYPRQKISVVEKKLKGANPVGVLEIDLRCGHSRSKYLDKYLEVSKGVKQHNIRARCNEEELVEEEQVECLIDLATDAHVLSKTYIGWNPWL